MSPSEPIESLPPKQRQVLEQLMAFASDYGYPPSIQQLCELCGVSSTSTIHYHLTALKKKGFIHGNPAEKRAITVREDLLEENTRGKLPLMGTIAAGSPLQTPDAPTLDEIDLAEDLCPPGCYALRVRGYSMIEDHIMDDDIVIINPKSRVRDGDVVVALVEDQTATLKRIYREKDGVRLQPANASMEPIWVRDVKVQGKVEAIIRQL
ncbi:MAG: transcriptional repressor LexA [Candidatus Melainabacteria bacterium]